MQWEIDAEEPIDIFDMLATYEKSEKKDPIVFMEDPIGFCRRVVEDHQSALAIDFEGDEVLIDASTANAVITIYDAINDENKKAFEAMGKAGLVAAMCKAAWGCLS